MLVGELRDDRATPRTANQQMLGHQFFDRAADSTDADAEFFGQLWLRGNLVACRPMAGAKALENSGTDDFIERLLSRNTKSWHSGQCQSEEKRIGESRSICDDMAARRTRNDPPLFAARAANSGRIQDRHPHESLRPM